jgi:hypothetical protein
MMSMSMPVGSLYDQDIDKLAVYSSPSRVKKDPVEMPDGSIYHGEWSIDGRVEGTGV